MEIEDWIAAAIAELRPKGMSMSHADARDPANDFLSALREVRTGDRGVPLGLRSSPVLRFHPGLQQAANLDPVRLIQA
jgi:hypothetical protein